jgi:hypothetical protein
MRAQLLAKILFEQEMEEYLSRTNKREPERISIKTFWVWKQIIE